MLIILNLEVVISDVDAKVGTPVSLDPTSASPSAANTQSRPQSQPQPQQQPQQQQQQQPLFNNTSTSYSSASPTFNSPGSFNSRPNMQLESSLTPIKNINPYQSR